MCRCTVATSWLPAGRGTWDTKQESHEVSRHQSSALLASAALQGQALCHLTLEASIGCPLSGQRLCLWKHREQGLAAGMDLGQEKKEPVLIQKFCLLLHGTTFRICMEQDGEDLREEKVYGDENSVS